MSLQSKPVDAQIAELYCHEKMPTDKEIQECINNINKRNRMKIEILIPIQIVNTNIHPSISHK